MVKKRWLKKGITSSKLDNEYGKEGGRKQSQTDVAIDVEEGHREFAEIVGLDEAVFIDE